MSVIKKFILLLKAQKADEVEDDYEVRLKEKGYTVKQVKTLDFTYINLKKLKEKLMKPDDYSGLIFSSPRCVNAVKLCLIDEHLSNDWKLKDNYTVGETTYKTALEELDLSCLGKDSGNANNLAEIILKDKNKYSKCFLYPHGNLKMDILKTKFENTNLCLEEIMVYETVSNKNIMKEFKDVTNAFSYLPQYIVFFSPSGVKAMEEILKALPLKSIKMIAIGPTTKTAMLQAEITVFGTAEKPTAHHLLNILLNDV